MGFFASGAFGRELFYFIIRISGIPFLIRNLGQRKSTTILLYHDVNPQDFKTQLDVITRYYNVISLKEYIESRSSKNADSLPKNSIVITFDDGHVGNFELLEILKNRNIPITIFLCSNVVNTQRHFWFKEAKILQVDVPSLKLSKASLRENFLKEYSFEKTREYDDRQALNREEIDKMKCAVDFQSHTCFHEILPTCSDELARSEIFDSKRYLESEFGLEIYAISYPNGEYSDRDIEFAREAGYKCGITVDCGFNYPTTNLYRLKRISFNESCGANEMVVKITGLFAFLRKIFS